MHASTGVSAKAGAEEVGWDCSGWKDADSACGSSDDVDGEGKGSFGLREVGLINGVIDSMEVRAMTPFDERGASEFRRRCSCEDREPFVLYKRSP